MAERLLRFPPTTLELLDPEARPYFLWWTDVSVGQLHALVRCENEEQRAYWLGAIMREANTRDVWVFASPRELRALWPKVVRHLGRTREMWAWLLGMPKPSWPPREARGA